MDEKGERCNYVAEVNEQEGFGESYDKEWALKDQGVKDGIAKGKEEKSSDIALAMLNDNLDIEIISKYTSLTIEETKSIQKG